MSKQKILIFIGSLTSGGAERVTVSLSRYISKIENYSVVVVTLNEKKFDFYKLDEGVKRITMNMSGETHGFQKITTNIKRMLKFREIVKIEQPDIVIGMITRQAVLSILACIGLSATLIVSERNYPPKRKNHSIWEILRSYLYRYADVHVVQTKKIANWLSANTGAKNIHIIPNSVKWPLPTYESKSDPKDFLDKNDHLILAVGALKHQKGFDLLIHAVSDLLLGMNHWKLVILGDEIDDGDDSSTSDVKKELLQLIDNYKLNNKILLPGRTGNVGDWYTRADIFVLSSRFEGFPNVLLEAMASGVACVAFDCDTGPRDLIEHQVNGLLVEPENISSLENSIEILMNDEALRKTLSGQAIQKRVEYSEHMILSKWIDLFEQIKGI